ncbi:MAG TPA: DUF1549 domain-containing protein, partial [Verrucomicrobiae bacterium]|nr:DUF1549 domain-containing protein [Verrucomicrobiae bacterium]
AISTSFSQASWSALIDQLLARPAYGERWARHWLDLVRYADSNGYERDAAKPFVWRYRDYVIRALNDDKPMDRFILEQIAGDELPDATAETIIATGFHRLGHWDDEPADPAADRYDQLDDMVRTTSEVFLGLTLACARCHDHKFEPLSTRDYYSMVAIFNPLERPRNGRTELTQPAGSAADLAAIQERDRNIESWRRDNAAIREQVTQEFLQSDQCQLPRETLAAWRTAPSLRTDEQTKLVTDTTAQFEAGLMAFMPEDKRAQLRANDAAIAACRAQTPDLVQGYFMHEPNPRPAPSHILVRGSPHQLGEQVSPAVPAILVKTQPAFPVPTSQTSQRRLGLARWLIDTDNPLTARVLVNRVWQQHFGAGLVRTPSDFGVMGEA